MKLNFGPLGKDTWLVCVDMQRLFLEPGEWFCPAGLDILPVIERLHSAAPERTLFTRFITAASPARAKGAWRRYYERWSSVTLDAMGPEMMDLHADLAPLAEPGRTFDKTGHDAFQTREFDRFIADANPGALVIFGIETDVCVLATVLSSVERGIRTIIPVDATASSAPKSHQAAIDFIYPRLDMQVELCDAETVVAALDES